jgi:hypothetical protein
LAKHGYTYRGTSAQRRAALREAAKEFGALGVYRKLNAVAKLTMRTIPKASDIFEEDRQWVKSSLGPLKG